MDTALNNAIAEQTKLQGEIAALQDRLRKVETFIALHREFSGQRQLPMPPAQPPAGDSGLGKRQSIPDAVADILVFDSPKTTQDLLAELDSAGIAVGGNEHSKRITNLSSSLSRDPRFLNTRGQGWSLRPTQKVESPSSAPTDDGLDDL